MDDIEKLKTENLELKDNVSKLENTLYATNQALRNAERTKEQLLRIIENLSKGYAGKEDKR